MAEGGANTMQNQINLLKDSMERGFSEIKAMLIAMDARTRAIEQSEARCFPVIDSRVTEVEKDIKAHNEDIKRLEGIAQRLEMAIEKQQGFNRIVSWAGGLAGTALILWVINSLLGLIK